MEIRTLSQQVYQHLLGKILSGHLGSGTVLNETDLSRKLAVSRTPVREAIRKLAADGFVEMKTARQAVVRHLQAEEVAHLYEVREALEVKAVELACGKLTAEDFALLDRLTEAAAKLNSPKHQQTCNRLDAELHALIAQRSGNPVLAREIERFRRLMHLLRDHLIRVPEGLELARRQHVEMIDALKGKKMSQARNAMRNHLQTFRKLHSQWVAEAQTQTEKTAM